MPRRFPERDEEIRTFLEQGLTCTQIARRLGLSMSVVSKTALRLGYRSRPGPPRKYDWEAIRQFYDAGHSARECRERYGFSAGAWDSAVARGDIVTREQRDPAQFSHTTRKAVAKLLSEGRTQIAAARRLGISKSTVAFHVRNLGIAPDERFSRRYDWKAIQLAYDVGRSAKECCELFGCSKASWSQAVARGELVSRPREMPLDELLVKGTKRGRHNIKRRLIEAGLKEEKCERCGITDWLGQPLSMELHHKNGDKLDNRIEELELLCPNCHSQTETWGGRNGRGRLLPNDEAPEDGSGGEDPAAGEEAS